jgi:hypothetical protein
LVWPSVPCLLKTTVWFSPQFLSDGPYSDSNHSHIDTPTTHNSTKHSHRQSEVLSTNTDEKNSSIINQMEIVTTWWEPYIKSISQPIQPWNGTKWCHDVLSTSFKWDNKWYGLMLDKVFNAVSSISTGEWQNE